MDHFLGRNDEQMQCRGVLHIVEAGDTLYRIGKKYGVPVSRIMYANPYVNVYNLQIGDEICVPVMTPRMLMGENDIPGSRMPAREDNMPGSRMPARENNMPGSRMPMHENPMMDSTMPMHENPMMDSRMPARENPIDESSMTVRRDCMEDSGMPGQKCMQRRAVPETDHGRNGMHGTVRGNRMGFPLAPLKEVIVDTDHETENRAYMGNRMTSAEDNSRSGMREAAPKPEEDQSMRNQPDTDHIQKRTGNGSSGCQQNPSESMCSGEVQTGGMRSLTENQELKNNPGREYAPGAEECAEKENYPGRRNSKALPWDDTGVSEKMMQEYLQEAPQETSKGL